MKVKWRFMKVFKRKEWGGVRGAWEGRAKGGKFWQCFCPFYLNYLDSYVPCLLSS